MAPFLLGLLVCGVLALADRGVGSPAFLLGRATRDPPGLIVGLTVVLALTNGIAGVAGTLVTGLMSGRSPLLLVALALLCAGVACVLGRPRTDPVDPWSGLAALALSRPLAAGAFVVFALSAWSGDLLPVAGATGGELGVLVLARVGGVRLPDRRAVRWTLAAGIVLVALCLAAAALGWV